ncbi:MAG: DNA double-strand break repair nuclease NurA [Candidatus Jordarchaeum sp.]|uniref:DNA double-strand break repair nuclease NurA n=1 Tax=Candidatus Jordarchaeum sp. TaxID=2823881 RepID=UPI00404B69C7
MVDLRPWVLESHISRIASEIQEVELARKKLAEAFRRIKDKEIFDLVQRSGFLDVFEKKLAYPVSPVKLEGMRVGAVDGGMISRSFHGIDLMLIRAVAAIFVYGSEGRVEVEYFPREYPPPAIVSNLEPLSRSDYEISASLERLLAEIKVATDSQGRHPMDIIILDGAILPQPSDRPSSPSLFKKYETVIRSLEKLYRISTGNGILLAGVVKDSRSTRFLQILSRLSPLLLGKVDELKDLLSFDYRRIIQRTRDTEFLYRFLDVGERTTTVKYAENSEKYGPLKDLKQEWAEKLNVFYLKPVELDSPLRVEYLSSDVNPIKTTQKISSLIYSLSCHHPEFGLPTVQVEAHAQAKLQETDLDFIYDQIVQKTGITPSLMYSKRRAYGV